MTRPTLVVLLAMALLAAPPALADDAQPAAVSNERAAELRADSPTAPPAPAAPDPDDAAPGAPASAPDEPAPSRALDQWLADIAGSDAGTSADGEPARQAPDGGERDPQPDEAGQPLFDTQQMEQRRLGSVEGEAGTSATDGSWMLNTLGALGLVIGLILVMRWAWQKLAGAPAAAGTSPVVEVLSRTAVAPRNHVLLIRVNHRVLVVGDSSAGLRTLASVDDPEEVADLLQATSSSQRRSFSRTLDRFDAQHETDLGGDDREHLVDRARDSVSSLLARLRSASTRGNTT